MKDSLYERESPNLTMPRVVDGHWLSVVMGCPRKALLRFGYGIVPRKPAIALRFGAAMHDAVHTWYKGGKTKDALKAALMTFGNLEEDEGDRRSRALGMRVMMDYATTYEREPFEVLESEVGFAVPFDDFVYGGRFDRIIQWEDGEVYVMETKTASGLGARWLKGWHPHTTITGYVWSVYQTSGHRCSACLLDGINTAENPKVRFLRDFTSRTEADVEEWKLTVRSAVRSWKDRLARAESPQKVFPQNPLHCHSYSGCEYRPLCISGTPASLVETLYERKAWEPFELEGKEDKSV